MQFIGDTVDALDFKAFYARDAGGSARKQPFHSANFCSALRGFGDGRRTLPDDMALVHPLGSEDIGEVLIGRAISWGGHVV